MASRTIPSPRSSETASPGRSHRSAGHGPPHGPSSETPAGGSAPSAVEKGVTPKRVWGPTLRPGGGAPRLQGLRAPRGDGVPAPPQRGRRGDQPGSPCWVPGPPSVLCTMPGLYHQELSLCQHRAWRTAGPWRGGDGPSSGPAGGQRGGALAASQSRRRPPGPRRGVGSPSAGSTHRWAPSCLCVPFICPVSQGSCRFRLALGRESCSQRLVGSSKHPRTLLL